MEEDEDVPLPIDKLKISLEAATLQYNNNSSISSGTNRYQSFVVLVSAGSFNPPTYMHLRLFELAKDALREQGYCVIGGYMSPVNDAYKKKDLVSALHRICMCELACRSSTFIMVDPWEARQANYQRTLNVLARIKGSLCQTGLIREESLKVMLLCGSDLLDSINVPGVWIPDQVRSLCKDFGIVCIHREGTDISGIISKNAILNDFMSNIISVDEIIPNQISSSRVRDCLRRGNSVKYLTPDEVIDYIEDQRLYGYASGGLILN